VWPLMNCERRGGMVTLKPNSAIASGVKLDTFLVLAERVKSRLERRKGTAGAEQKGNPSGAEGEPERAKGPPRRQSGHQGASADFSDGLH